MHLFLIAGGAGPPGAASLTRALERASRRIASLQDAERWALTSPSGALVAAGLHHAARRSAPRRYRHLDDEGRMTAYDGLPLLGEGDAPWDAATLARRWGDLPRRMEGACCAFQLRPAADAGELITDPIGMLPVYRAGFDGGWVVSNSLLAVRSLLDRHELDEEAAATFLCLGWALGERTIVEGISVVRGGTRLALGPGGVEEHRHFGPETVARLVNSGRPPIRALADRLVPLVADGAEAIGVPVTAAITAGRDSRVCLALLRAAGADARYVTGGVAGEPDIEVAKALAARFGFPHRAAPPPLAELPPETLIDTFVDQNDGMTSLELLRDHTGQLEVPDRIGVMVSGMGGEMVRGGSSLMVAFTANLRPLSDLRRFQHRFVQLKIDPGVGLVREDAVASARRQVGLSLDGFATAGWPVHTLNEAFYIFERIGKWGTTSARRTAATADLLSPLSTRVFLEYGISARAGERYQEQTHHDLLGHLEPALRDAPFEFPWRPQHRRLAPLGVAAEGARLAAGRLAARRTARRPPAPPGEYAHARQRNWDALRPAYAAALERAGDDSPVYAVVHRDELRRAVEGPNPPGQLVDRAMTIAVALADR